MRRLVAIALLVLLAGCLQQGGGTITQSAQAVAIRSFAPDIAELTEKDRVDLTLAVENRGAFDAADLNASLFLRGDFEPLPGTNWNQGPYTLRPPNVRLQTPGEVREFVWSVKAPTLGKGVKDYPFDFKADVSYNYQSSAWKQFPIIEYSRLQQLKAANKPLPESTSGGLPSPIRMDINIYEPVVYSEGDNKVTLKVLLQKQAEGYAKAESAEFEAGTCNGRVHCIDSVTLEIPEGLKFTDDCDFAFTMPTDASATAEFINLVDGDRAQLKCTLEIDSMTELEAYPMVKASALYRYHVEGSTGVTVIKVVE